MRNKGMHGAAHVLIRICLFTNETHNIRRRCGALPEDVGAVLSVKTVTWSTSSRRPQRESRSPPGRSDGRSPCADNFEDRVLGPNVREGNTFDRSQIDNFNQF
ncbi:hypothetical protein MTP99_014793 [Tenebrio molitor]|nr:hypothetical protein MTP99_014793 [Tenebrio molitor]